MTPGYAPDYTRLVQYDNHNLTVLQGPRKNPYSTGGQTPWAVAPLATVVVQAGFAYGQETIALYDPFHLYDSWRERRDGALPPHLVFLNLVREDAAARAFLETYGPLTEPPQESLSAKDVQRELGIPLGQAARAAQQQLGKARSYWQKRSPRPLSSPSLALAYRTGFWRRVNLVQFWAEQNEFRFLYSLWEVLKNSRLGVELKASLLGARGTTLARKLNQHFRAADWQALESNIEAESAESLRQKAFGFLGGRVSLRLIHVHPTLWFEPHGSTALRHFWNCENLLETLYMMFFLDISLERRVLRCEGCGILFADAKENVRYCSTGCETRTRVRNWWRQHGRAYRAKRRKNRSRNRQTKARTSRQERKH